MGPEATHSTSELASSPVKKGIITVTTLGDIYRPMMMYVEHSVHVRVHDYRNIFILTKLYSKIIWMLPRFILLAFYCGNSLIQ